MEPAKEQEIVRHLENDSMVIRVIDPKSEEMGDGVFRCAPPALASLPAAGPPPHRPPPRCSSHAEPPVVPGPLSRAGVQRGGAATRCGCPPLPTTVLVTALSALSSWRPQRPALRRRFKAEIQWSGEHVVQKYLASQGRDNLYRQIRKAACEVPPGAVPQSAMEDAIDRAMMEFGEPLPPLPLLRTPPLPARTHGCLAWGLPGTPRAVPAACSRSPLLPLLAPPCL